MTINEYRDMVAEKVIEAEKELVKAKVRLEVVDDFIAMGATIEEKDNEEEYSEAQGVDPVVVATDESY